MRKSKALLIYVLFTGFLFFLVDHFYIPSLQKELSAVESETVAVANKLNTARIVQENLLHVRDLVFQNMQVPGYVDSVSVETSLFHFLTEGVQDLKLKLIGVKPLPPRLDGRVITYPYEIEVEGDFFKFGELCSKYENSRRIINLKEFSVELVNASDDIDERMKSMNQPVKIKMSLETYWVK
jgi:Tfp pilus assembly protein PilO